MLNPKVETGRIRAYLLYRVKDVDHGVSLASEIYEKLRHRGGDGYVVIRAEVVEGTKQNEVYVIVPVDAENKTKLGLAIKAIKDEVGPDVYSKLEVAEHFPSLTYLAQGFVSIKERNHARENFILEPDEVGRIRKKSPGDNPWG